MKMNKFLALALAVIIGVSMVGCGASEGNETTAITGNAETEKGAQEGGAMAGAVWSSFADTFIANARQTLENISAADGTIQVNSADSQGAIETQTSNVSNFYTQGVKYLVLNNLNTNAISEICNDADENDVTLIIANSDSPSDEDFEKHEDLYFISSQAELSGRIMGEALAEYWNANPSADRNGNGKLDYIMLLGQQGVYDTLMRSGKSVEALENAGIEVNCIGGEQLCEWSRATAQEKVQALLANYSEDIDAIISCNDDMALGAIEALKAGGFFTGEDTYIPVCGVDGTAVGVEAVSNGTMLVTALNNPVTLSKTVYKVMYLLENGKEVNTENLGIEGATVEGRRIWLGYTAITKDNVDAASYDTSDVSF